MSTKVVICGDTRRPLSQRGNVEVIFHLVQPHIKMAGLTPVLLSDESTILDEGSWLARESFPERIGADAWQVDRHGEDAIYVAFEPDAKLIETCRRRSIPLVDIRISPIRFCDDLLFGIRTSGLLEIPAWAAADPAWIQAQAGACLAASIRTPAFPTVGGTTLVVGQTRRDRSVVSGARFARLSDFRTRLGQSAKALIYRPHPYADKESVAEDVDLLRGIGLPLSIHGCEFTPYRLLADPNVDRVVSLSSSFCHEAKVCGRYGETLLHPWWDGYTDVHPRHVLSGRFWGELSGRPSVSSTDIWTPNLLRRTFGVWWGMEFMRA